MERVEWLKKVRTQTEALYDHIAPAYWTKFGLYTNATQCQFLGKLLERLAAQSFILDAACGAGRYAGMLLDAGHTVLGIDQSDGMLARAREYYPQERFPGLHYARIGLKEMEFRAQFNGVVCIDALEHVFPEDWPGILVRFQQALKPGGVLYFTVELMEPDEVSQAFEQAKAQGLPVVFGELAGKIEAAFTQLKALDWQDISGELAGLAAYHYYPPLKQVRSWLDQVRLSIEEEGTGDGYAHFLVRN